MRDRYIITIIIRIPHCTTNQCGIHVLATPKLRQADTSPRKATFFHLRTLQTLRKLKKKLHSVAKWKWSPARFATSFRRAAVLSVQACSNVWRVKRSALRLRLTGSVVQPMSCYDLLTYKAIGSNYLSFVVTSSSSFHNATGWSRNCDKWSEFCAQLWWLPFTTF